MPSLQRIASPGGSRSHKNTHQSIFLSALSMHYGTMASWHALQNGLVDGNSIILLPTHALYHIHKFLFIYLFIYFYIKLLAYHIPQKSVLLA